MIKATVKNGTIQALESLPEEWKDGQELVVAEFEPTTCAEDLNSWLERLKELSAQIPRDDHARVEAALVQQDKESKEHVRREMGGSGG